ncbi:MAG: hypothetical protein AB1452_08130 [Pseudomonadota bacterium]
MKLPRIRMNTRFDAARAADAILSREEEDEGPIVAWSLDELDSDLDSIRSAWHADGPGA